MKKYLIVVFSLILISCIKNKVNAEFTEIKDNIARFDIVNNVDKDIKKITFEIKYLDELDNLMFTDTVSYQMGKGNEKVIAPFLKANDKNFIVQNIPDNCKKAAIKILEIDEIE